ncbi:methyl-accepting chemotaxis protein [Aquincola sp. S2]|uniref:Methyl-accepting chemotaxis protein n=1 Tax=Pseudaquabacterium terrae TaxID=2732868 RepID=A0ABX2EIK3_9BURK|nr:methyl-accepting chemotaxis protein [Aquabacterium terrae]NRF68464.1 methyl-accepting chemotaxis protein [Aquabacterium terrae]
MALFSAIRSCPKEIRNMLRSLRPDVRERRSSATSWKRDVTLFALMLITLVIAIAGSSGGLLWLHLRESSAAEIEWTVKLRSASDARQATVEVDRLLMKTIALKEAGAVRAAAVASIAAATKVEEAINALVAVMPDDAAPREMATAVDEAKAPRMRVIALARRNNADGAIEALAAIDPTLRRIDEMSSALLTRLYQQREEAASAQQRRFTQLLYALGGAAAGGTALGLLFYAVLMRRLKRVDQIEHLLVEVQQGSRQLADDGGKLEELNLELRQATDALGASVGRFRESFGAMEGESGQAVNQIGVIAKSCDASASTSREQASHAAAMARHISTTAQEMSTLRMVTLDLSGSQRQIADFTDRIARIAATTRLLSMNAAVEAARAGDAGRGFNVVAQSIRQLSDDTQAAASEIRRTNEHIAAQLALTIQAVERTGTHMRVCTDEASVLQESAGHNCRLVTGVAEQLSMFHDVLDRQARRVRDLEGDVAVLDRSFEVGSRQAQRLDETAGSLNQVSSAMQSRLTSMA